jgi:hypothetical protein
MTWQEIVEHLKREPGNNTACTTDRRCWVTYYEDADFTGFCVDQREIHLSACTEQGATRVLEEVCLPRNQEWRMLLAGCRRERQG